MSEKCLFLHTLPCLLKPYLASTVCEKQYLSLVLIYFSLIRWEDGHLFMFYTSLYITLLNVC